MGLKRGTVATSRVSAHCLLTVRRVEHRLGGTIINMGRLPRLWFSLLWSSLFYVGDLSSGHGSGYEIRAVTIVARALGRALSRQLPSK
jgi:hypothetical protein